MAVSRAYLILAAGAVTGAGFTARIFGATLTPTNKNELSKHAGRAP